MKMVYSIYWKQRILYLRIKGFRAPTIARIMKEEENIPVTQVGVHEVFRGFDESGCILSRHGSGRRSKITMEINQTSGRSPDATWQRDNSPPIARIAWVKGIQPVIKDHSSLPLLFGMDLSRKRLLLADSRSQHGEEIWIGLLTTGMKLSTMSSLRTNALCKFWATGGFVVGNKAKHLVRNPGWFDKIYIAIACKLYVRLIHVSNTSTSVRLSSLDGTALFFLVNSQAIQYCPRNLAKITVNLVLWRIVHIRICKNMYSIYTHTCVCIISTFLCVSVGLNILTKFISGQELV